MILQRFFNDSKMTLGILYFGDTFFYVLEDTKRDKKIKGQTRIPAGVYEVDKLKVLTPKTEQYRAKYSWFDFHIHIKNVPNFENVYIHIGNTHRDTEGCLLIGNKATKETIEESTKAFRQFYKNFKPQKLTIIDN